MRSTRNLFLSLFYISLIIAIAGGLWWANTRFSRIVFEGSEFLTLWAGGQALLDGQEDIYSAGIVEQAYDQILNPGSISQLNLMRLDLPIYIHLIFLPVAMIEEIHQARGIWMLILEVGLGALIILNLFLARIKQNPLISGILILFGITWIHGFLPILTGNSVILAAVFFTASLLSIRAKLDELAGAFIALATFRVEGLIFAIIFLFFWAISNRRWRIIWGFIMGISILLVIGTIIHPGWFLPYIRAIVANLQNPTLLTPSRVLMDWWPGIGDRLGWLINGLFVAILLLEWRASKGKDFRWFLWTSALSLAITPMLGVPTQPVNYIILVIPLILFLSIGIERWQDSSWWVISILLLAIFVSLWAIFIVHIPNGLDSVYRLLFFPLPVSLIISLYWVRWWGIRSPISWEAGRSLDI